MDVFESKVTGRRISTEIPIMKNKSHIVALSLLIVLSAGCDWRGIRGNGTIKTEQRPVTSFTRIEAGGFYDIRWQPGPPSLSLTTDENLLSQIETRNSGSVLKIETKGQIAPTHGVTVVITSPSLAGAELSGALKLEASQLSGDSFALDTSGAAKVTLAWPHQSAHCEPDWRQQTQCRDAPGRRRRNLRHRRGTSGRLWPLIRSRQRSPVRAG